MRLISILFIVLVSAVLSVRSENISISGYVRNPEKIDIQRMQCYVMNDRPQEFKPGSTIRLPVVVDPSGLYRLDYYKPSYELKADEWYTDCVKLISNPDNSNESKEYSARSLNPAIFEPYPRVVEENGVKINVYVAAVEDLILNSATDSNKSATETSNLPRISNTNVAALKMPYTVNIPTIETEDDKPTTNNCFEVPVSRKIAERAARIEYQVKYNEISEVKGTEELKKQTAQILAVTPLGENEKETLVKINEEIVRKYGTKVRLLPVIKDKEQFKLLRNGEEVKKTRPKTNTKTNISRIRLTDNSSVLREKFGFLESNKQLGLSQPYSDNIILNFFNQSTKYKVCASVIASGNTSEDKCSGELVGNSWEEVRDAGLKQICGDNPTCVKQAKANNNNVKIFKNNELIITHLSF